METLDRNALTKLIRKDPRVAVTLCLPSHQNEGYEATGDPRRLKGLLKEAESELRGLDLSAREVDKLLAPAREALDDAQFWQQTGAGVALFLADGYFRSYALP